MDWKETEALSPDQTARLLMEDGLTMASDEDEAMEGQCLADRSLRDALARALREVEVPQLADAVMNRLGGSSIPVAQGLAEEAGAPSLAGEIMQGLGGQQSLRDLVSSALRTEAGEPEPLWNDLAGAVGCAVDREGGLSLRDAVRQEASSQFDSRVWADRQQRWPVMASVGVGFALAVAAAFLLYVAIGDSSVPPVEAAMAPLMEAPIEIESVEVGTVEVVQYDDHSPTIILIEEEGQLQ